MVISSVADIQGIRFSERDKYNKEIGRAYLYIMRNDLHEKPFGFMEDVEIAETHRGKGIGSQLVKELIGTAKNISCYKLIAGSRHNRPKVHQLYERLGFRNHGVEFRIDF